MSFDLVQVNMDFTPYFTTNQRFPSRGDVLEWLKEVGRTQGIGIVTRSASLEQKGKRIPTVYYSCERGGRYRAHRKESESSRKDQSKKCECPFAVCATMVAKDEWTVKVTCGLHNHPVQPPPAIADDWKVKGLEILSTRAEEFLQELKKNDQFRSAKMKTISNARCRLKGGHNIAFSEILREFVYRDMEAEAAAHGVMHAEEMRGDTQTADQLAALNDYDALVSGEKSNTEVLDDTGEGCEVVLVPDGVDVDGDVELKNAAGNVEQWAEEAEWENIGFELDALLDEDYDGVGAEGVDGELMYVDDGHVDGLKEEKDMVSAWMNEEYVDSRVVAEVETGVIGKETDNVGIEMENGGVDAVNVVDKKTDDGLEEGVVAAGLLELVGGCDRGKEMAADGLLDVLGGRGRVDEVVVEEVRSMHEVVRRMPDDVERDEELMGSDGVDCHIGKRRKKMVTVGRGMCNGRGRVTQSEGRARAAKTVKRQNPKPTPFYDEAYDIPEIFRIPFKIDFHECIRDLVVDVHNVKADGNCGFRAVAHQLGLGEDKWRDVRRAMLKELLENPDFYIEVFEDVGEHKRIVEAVSYFEEEKAPPERWMQLPEMGHVIASAYKCVVHFFGFRQCLTFFPFHSAPEPTDTRLVIYLGHVQDNHFVIPKLEPDAPVPPPTARWKELHYTVADGWMDEYEGRMQAFTNMVGQNMSTVEYHLDA